MAEVDFKTKLAHVAFIAATVDHFGIAEGFAGIGSLLPILDNDIGQLVRRISWNHDTALQLAAARGPPPELVTLPFLLGRKLYATNLWIFQRIVGPSGRIKWLHRCNNHRDAPKKTIQSCITANIYINPLPPKPQKIMTQWQTCYKDWRTYTK